MQINLPKRSAQHKVETESVALLRDQLGSDWVFRDHQDRDYGVDVHLELFDDENPTGLVLYGQVKGTAEDFENEVKLNGFPTKTANYANLFAVPFFVFFISIKSKKTKFVWLQEYLRLNVRPSQLLSQESITITFPSENTLCEDGNEKIREILRKQKLYKSALLFITHYERLINQIAALSPRRDEKQVAGMCLIQIIEIQKLSLVKQKIEEKDIFSCDFDAAITLLKSICSGELEVTKKVVSDLERIIFSFKLKKLELLNLDISDAIVTWQTGQKAY